MNNQQNYLQPLPDANTRSIQDAFARNLQSALSQFVSRTGQIPFSSAADRYSLGVAASTGGRSSRAVRDFDSITFGEADESAHLSQSAPRRKSKKRSQKKASINKGSGKAKGGRSSKKSSGGGKSSKKSSGGGKRHKAGKSKKSAAAGGKRSKKVVTSSTATKQIQIDNPLF